MTTKLPHLPNQLTADEKEEKTVTYMSVSSSQLLQNLQVKTQSYNQIEQKAVFHLVSRCFQGYGVLDNYNL